jgi:hypothetical protein
MTTTSASSFGVAAARVVVVVDARGDDALDAATRRGATGTPRALIRRVDDVDDDDDDIARARGAPTRAVGIAAWDAIDPPCGTARGASTATRVDVTCVRARCRVRLGTVTSRVISC